ncbi:DUF551 domain-containing protein [Serratia marcescens]|uniref:DUF551 domain-containing protein n=1 Tax=Serratia marcescens TaxID=615 RepID=UPI001F26BA90|nr:DUF551 domain-containing protein [Serratia marcescens]
MTLTTERLKALLDELKSWQYGYDPVDDKEQFDMLATAEWAVIELLANRDAQPVAWSTVFGDKRAVTVHADTAEVWNSDGLQVQSLYTAPPAPAVNASPDFESWFVEKYKQPERLMKNEDGAYKFSGVQMAFSAWSDGRAAMLNVSFIGEGDMAQPVSGGYKLPESWIACSEQTPVADGAYWCWFGKEKPSVIQQRVCIWNDRNHEWCDSAVTHWMPLPVAPEGGNG